MAFEVRFTDQAERDADSILAWLLNEGAGDAGSRWFFGLQDAILSLAERPLRCPLAAESQEFRFEVRQLLYGRRPHVYRILFSVERTVVNILHIRHGRRLPLKR